MTDKINQSDLLSKADDARRRAEELSGSLNNMKSRLRQSMQVRRSLKKFPHLRDIVKDGFDYSGFCNTIEQSPELTPSGMALAKDMFNPNKRIGSAFFRGGKQLAEQYKKCFLVTPMA